MMLPISCVKQPPCTQETSLMFAHVNLSRTVTRNLKLGSENPFHFSAPFVPQNHGLNVASQCWACEDSPRDFYCRDGR